MGKVTNVIPPKGIAIKLDKPRVLRFTMTSLAWLAEKYGTVGSALEILSSMDKGNAFNSDELIAISDVVCAGLVTDDPTITPQFVRDNFDLADIIAIMPSLIKAFLQSMPIPRPIASGAEKDPQKA